MGPKGKNTMSYKGPEQITIKITNELIQVVSGKTKGARLAYHAAGLQIWKIGKSDYHHVDCVTNLAMQACDARHIPLASLRHVFANNRVKSSFSTETTPMLGDE